MTICKTFCLFNKGGIYKKAGIIEDLGPGEFMPAHYYDPSLNTICSFYNEDSEDWDNRHDSNQSRFKRRAGGPLELTFPRWEQGKKRVVFFHSTHHAAGDYAYLGYAMDSPQTTVSGTGEWAVLTLH